MFSSRRENDHNITIYDTYIMNADGSGIERLAEDIFGRLSPEWSPDGNRIVFSARGEIYVTNVDGSGLMRLTENEYLDYDPVWSPAMD